MFSSCTMWNVSTESVLRCWCGVEQKKSSSLLGAKRDTILNSFNSLSLARQTLTQLSSPLIVHLAESQEMAESTRVPEQEADARTWCGSTTLLRGWHCFRRFRCCKETQWVLETPKHKQSWITYIYRCWSAETKVMFWILLEKKITICSFNDFLLNSLIFFKKELHVIEVFLKDPVKSS